MILKSTWTYKIQAFYRGVYSQVNIKALYFKWFTMGGIGWGGGMSTNWTIGLFSLSDHFRRRDTTQTGHAQFGYDDVSISRWNILLNRQFTVFLILFHRIFSLTLLPHFLWSWCLQSSKIRFRRRTIHRYRKNIEAAGTIYLVETKCINSLIQEKLNLEMGKYFPLRVHRFQFTALQVYLSFPLARNSAMLAEN